ncbi:MAG: YcxB family protein [Lachnospiraceae bacterium]|nr:YcxB family protein [Lachnospiraceae bacterium]
MKVEVDVNMTTPVMYDYMMYHTLTGVQFWMAVAIAVMLWVMFFVNRNPLYLLAGIAVLVYLPVERYLQAKKQVTLNPVFKETLHYTLDDEKMSIDVLDEHMEAPWDSVVKVRSTKKSLILYTNSVAATILPREALGGDYDKVVGFIKNGVPAKCVKVRG